MTKRLMMLTAGAYSDYGVLCVVDWLSDVEPRLALCAFLDAHPEQKEPYHFEDDQFVAWLLANGYAEEVHTDEFHVGDYGTADYKSDEQLEEERAFREEQLAREARVALYYKDGVIGRRTPFATGDQCTATREFSAPESSGFLRCYLQAGHDGPHKMVGDE